MSTQKYDLLPHNPYKSLRFGLQRYMLNLAPFFSPEWFTDAFIKLFGDPCYTLTQCGICFSTALFFRLLLIHSSTV